MPVSTFAEVATRSTPDRKHFCTSCDAPIYEEEGHCRYCAAHAHGFPRDLLLILVGVAVLLILASAQVALGH